MGQARAPTPARAAPAAPLAAAAAAASAAQQPVPKRSLSCRCSAPSPRHRGTLTHAQRERERVLAFPFICMVGKSGGFVHSQLYVEDADRCGGVWVWWLTGAGWFCCVCVGDLIHCLHLLHRFGRQAIVVEPRPLACCCRAMPLLGSVIITCVSSSLVPCSCRSAPMPSSEGWLEKLRPEGECYRDSERERERERESSSESTPPVLPLL
eukprot:COSAG02_NODE_3358_length_6873_cov_18.182315_2_plen_209_part_00